MMSLRNLISEAEMNRTGKSYGAPKVLDRAADYVSGSGLALSFWILSVVFILGRILVVPF